MSPTASSSAWPICLIEGSPCERTRRSSPRPCRPASSAACASWLDDWAGGCLADLDADQQAALTQRLRDVSPGLALLLVNVVVRCYYRDDRVMRSLNMELRPPFTKGFELEQGDWSLLDPVRARGQAYREVP